MESGLNNWSTRKSHNGERNQVSGRVSAPCWHATPVANASRKPLNSVKVARHRRLKKLTKVKVIYITLVWHNRIFTRFFMLNADMNICILYKTDGILFLSNLYLKQSIGYVYVTVNFICMALLELRKRKSSISLTKQEIFATEEFENTTLRFFL